MKRWNLSAIMTRAWKLFRKGGLTFSECLHRAWNSAKAKPINEQRIMAAKEAAGVTEECHTWSDWKALGYEVIHGSKALFQAVLIHASKGDGKVYTASFFAISQVQPIEAEEAA